MKHLRIPQGRQMGAFVGTLAVLALLLPAASSAAVEPQFELRQAAGLAAVPPLPSPALFPVQLVLDDDEQEAVFGISDAGGARQFLWFNRFAMPAGVESFQLQEIWVLFPGGAGMSVGADVQLAVYQDPDGDPTNGAGLLATVSETIQATDDQTFSVYPLNPPVTVSGTGDVLIGVVNRFTQPGDPPVSPAAIDTTASQGRSWFALWNAAPPDPPVLPADNLTTRIDDFFPAASGNWMIRGFGAPVVPIAEIPTASSLGLAALGLLLALAALWLLRRRAAALALAFLLLPAGAAQAQIEIDPFTTAQAALTLQDPPDSPGDRESSNVPAGAMIGATRDLEITWLSGGTGPVSTEVTGGNLVFSVAADSRAEIIATWDGDTDPDDLTTGPGFAGGPALNLITAGGGPASAFALTVGSAPDGTEVVIQVYSSASDFSSSSRLLPAIAASTTVFFDFSTFIPDPAGSGVDFTSVVAIRLILRASDGSASFDVLETVAPNLAATKIDVLSDDVDMDSVADPGDELTYTITLENTGGEGLSVDLADMVDANTTLVADSVNSTPVAKQDSYLGIGNVQVVADGSPGRAGLLANDTDPDGGTVSVQSVTSPTARGGTVSLDNAATGAFTYNPPAGERGVDSFTYTIVDEEGTVDTAEAVINLDRLIWFVDNTNIGCGSPPCGSGTAADPFATMLQAQAASAPNDVIRVREGDGTDTGHNAGFTLKDGQHLIGGAADLVIGGNVIEAGAGPSVHSHSVGHALVLASNNRIEGLVANPTAGTFHGIFGSGSSNAVIDGVTINPGGDAGGIRLDNHSGGFTFANSAVTAAGSASGIAVHVTNSGGVFDFASGSSIAQDGGGLIHVTGAAAGSTHDFSGTNPTLTNGTLDGIRLSGNDAASSFTFTGIGNVSTTGTVPMLEGGPEIAGGGGPAHAVFITGSGTVTVGSFGNLSSVSGAALSVSGTTVVKPGGGAVPVASLFSDQSDVQGLFLDGVAPGVTVTGTTTFTMAFGGAARLIGSGPVTFTGQAQLGAASSTGLFANATGLVTISDNSSTISAGGAGVDVTDTALAVNVASINCGGGVTLTNATGSLTSGGGGIGGPGSGPAVNVVNGSPTVSHSGTVTQNNAQRVVNIEGTTGGSVSFPGGAVTGGASSLGVRIHDADGNASFADLNLGTSGSPMTNQALTLTGGSTGTFTFAGTQIFTTGARGVQADNGGVVQFTGAGNRVTATNARALTFENGTTIGGSGATFERIDASGSDRGIRLVSAGSGFTVTGDGPNGTDGSGGVIATMTTRGVEIISTNTVTLRNVDLNNAATTNGGDPTNDASNCGSLETGSNVDCTAAVHLQTMSDAVLDNVDVNGSVQQGVNGRTVTNLRIENSRIENVGNQVREHGLNLFNTAGTLILLDSVINNPEDNGARMYNNTGTLNMTVRRTTVTNNKGANGNDGIQMEIDGGTTNLLVDDSDFTQLSRDGLDAIAEASGVLNVTVQGSRFNNSDGFGGVILANDGNSVIRTLISGNTIENNISNAINLFSAGDSQMDATIIGNTIQHPLTANIGFGIRVIQEENSDVDVHIENNNISDVAQGILARARSVDPGSPQQGTMDVTVETTTVTNSDIGIQIDAGVSTGTHENLVCLNTSIAGGAGNNNITGTTTLDWLINRRSNAVFRIENLGAATVASHVQSNNVGTPNVFTVGTQVDAPAACDTPAGAPLPPPI